MGGVHIYSVFDRLCSVGLAKTTRSTTRLGGNQPSISISLNLIKPINKLLFILIRSKNLQVASLELIVKGCHWG